LLGCLAGFLVLLALVFGVLLHVTVLAEALSILGFVWAAGGTLFSATLEVTIDAHSFGIVLLVDMWTFGDRIFLADDRFFTFGAPGAAAASLLADQFLVEVHWLDSVLQVFGS